MADRGRMSVKRIFAKLALALAFGLLVASAPALASSYFHTVSAQELVKCEVVGDDPAASYLSIWLPQSGRLSLAPLELGLDRCPAAGAIVEKRRGELGFRVDGRLLVQNVPDEHLAALWLGLLLLGVAVVLGWWSRGSHTVVVTENRRALSLLRGAVGLFAVLMLALVVLLGGEWTLGGMLAVFVIAAGLLILMLLSPELLAVGERIPPPPRRWRGPLLALVFVGSVALWFVGSWKLGASECRQCETRARSLKSAWNEERRLDVRWQFDKQPGGAADFSELDRLLSQYTTQAAELYRELCSALPRKQRRWADVGDARFECLWERWRSVNKLVGEALAGRPADELLSDARQLEPVERCRGNTSP